MMNTVVRLAVVVALVFVSELQSADHECGIQTFEDKYPWTVLIRYKRPNSNERLWGCGGSLVGTRTILTAAHCVDGFAKTSLGEIEFVRLGEYDHSMDMDCVKLRNFEDCTEKPVDKKVTNIVIHPERNANSRLHDIAILTLESAPPYTDFIRPICLPNGTIEDRNGKRSDLYVAGWGWTVGSVLSPSNVKMDSILNLVSGSDCRQIYPNIDENLQVCAGGSDGHNACRGDSGGPSNVFRGQQMDSGGRCLIRSNILWTNWSQWCTSCFHQNVELSAMVRKCSCVIDQQAPSWRA